MRDKQSAAGAASKEKEGSPRGHEEDERESPSDHERDGEELSSEDAEEEEEEKDDDALFADVFGDSDESLEEENEENEEEDGEEERMIDSEDEELDEDILHMKHEVRSLMTYLASDFIPTMRRMDESRCIEAIPTIEAQEKAEYAAELQMLSVGRGNGSRTGGGSKIEISCVPPHPHLLSIRPLLDSKDVVVGDHGIPAAPSFSEADSVKMSQPANTTEPPRSTAGNKKKGTSKSRAKAVAASSDTQRLQPYSREDLYAPLPTSEHELKRFEYVAKAMIPGHLQFEIGKQCEFSDPTEIIQNIINAPKLAERSAHFLEKLKAMREARKSSSSSPLLASATGVSVGNVDMANKSGTPEAPPQPAPRTRRRVEVAAERFTNPRILNIPTTPLTTSVLEYGCHRGERPVVFNASNVWDHFEGGWTQKKIPNNKNLFLDARYKENQAKAGLFMGLLNKRLNGNVTEEKDKEEKVPMGSDKKSIDGSRHDDDTVTDESGQSGEKTASATMSGDEAAAAATALAYLASTDPYFHLKLPPFGSRAYRFLYEQPMFDVIMAIPLRKFDMIFVYAALARMGPTSDHVAEFYEQQIATSKLSGSQQGFLIGSGGPNGNQGEDAGFTDARRLVFALDALVRDDTGEDPSNRNRPWLKKMKGFGLVNYAYPLLATFLHAASVVCWRLVAIGERHGEAVDAINMFHNLMQVSTQYVQRERELLDRLRNAYAKRVNKGKPKSRHIRPEHILHVIFSDADALPLRRHRNTFVTLLECTRKKFMNAIERISRLPSNSSRMLWPEEDARLNAIRHLWSEHEENKSGNMNTIGKKESPSLSRSSSPIFEGVRERKKGQKWSGDRQDDDTPEAKEEEKESCTTQTEVPKIGEKHLRPPNQPFFPPCASYLTSELLWGLASQRMCQTDTDGREPYLNLEPALLESAGENVNYFGEWNGEKSEEDKPYSAATKSAVPLLRYETRTNIRRWGTPFGAGSICYSRLFADLPAPYVLSSSTSESTSATATTSDPNAIAQNFGATTKRTSENDKEVQAQQLSSIGPFPLNCSFAPPHLLKTQNGVKRVAVTLRQRLVALNTEDEPHFWAAFGDYLADTRIADTITSNALATDAEDNLQQKQQKHPAASPTPCPLLTFPISHPLHIFSVGLTCPAVSLDGLASCDLCCRRNLKLGYEAKSGGGAAAVGAAAPTPIVFFPSSSGDPHNRPLQTISSLLPETLSAEAPELNVPKRIGGREQFHLVSDVQQAGFDVCVTCAAAMVLEAHTAMLTAVGAIHVRKSEGSVVEANHNVCLFSSSKTITECQQESPAPSVEGERFPPRPERVVSLDEGLGRALSRRVAISLSSSSPQADITKGVGVGVGEGSTHPSDHLVCLRPVAVLSSSIGSRASLSINNQIRVGSFAKVKLAANSGGGLLYLYLALSPIGARPIARIWGNSYDDLLVKSVLNKDGRTLSHHTTTSAGNGEGTSSTNPLCADHHHFPNYADHPMYEAGRRILCAGASLRNFFSNGARVATRQLLRRNFRDPQNDKNDEDRENGDKHKREAGSFFADNNGDDVDGGNDYDECPICLEPLQFVGGGGGVGGAPSAGHHPDTQMLCRESTASMLATVAGGSESRQAELDFPFLFATCTESTAENKSSFKKEESRNGSGGIAVAKQTSCGHWFHPQCLERFMVTSKTTTCPVCRCPDALQSLAVRQMRAVERRKKARGVELHERLAAEEEEEGGMEGNGRPIHIGVGDLAPSSLAVNDGEEEEEEEEAADDDIHDNTVGHNTLEVGELVDEDHEEWEPEEESKGEEEDEGEEVGPSAIIAATEQTLYQNLYEVRIPLTPEQAARFSNSSFLGRSTAREDAEGEKGEPAAALHVIVGTLVNNNAEYHTPLDVGCLAKIAIPYR